MIPIGRLDSIENKSHGPDGMPHKQLWLAAAGIANYRFLSLYKQQTGRHSDDEYTLTINYRDFSGELNVAKLNDTIDNEYTKYKSQYKKNLIKQIFWSKKEGLVGYTKQDGQIYKKVK